MPVSRKRADDLSRTLTERVDMNDLRARSPRALTELARAFSAPLYRFVARMVGQEADAQDVVQQTFASVVDRIDGFEGGPDRLRSWVFTIAYRAAMDVLRGRRRALPLEGDVPAASADPIDLETPATDVRRAFVALSPQDQYVLTLKYQDDFSNPEIAEILGLTPNHVGVLLYRAKQNLRRAVLT